MAEHLSFLDWPEYKKRVQYVKVQNKANAAVRESVLRSAVYTFDLEEDAYKVEKQISRDVDYLREALFDTSVPIERRAKILEVMVLRGANNERPSDLLRAWGATTGDKSAGEQLRNQAAVWITLRDGDPQLFNHLSRSGDQLPDPRSGRYPATEFMNTMLRENGFAGTHEKRQEFKDWLVNLPPEQRGQAVFHLKDAMGASERGASGKVTGVETPIGGISWEEPKDTHWQTVNDDLMGPVARSLNAEQQGAFEKGYIESSERRGERILK
jgi:hypothetical protein